jgi:hypothetical protein
MRFRTAILAPCLLLAFVVEGAWANDAALLALDAQHFKDTAIVKEDLNNGTTTISTEAGFIDRSGFVRMAWHDEYLQGVIDKKTGTKSFRVDSLISYSGSFRLYQSVNFKTAGGPQSVPVVEISKKESNCTAGDCAYTEHVSFPVEEALLRQLAAGGSPSKPAIWSFKFIAKSGPDCAGQLSSAEINGLLAKMDEYSNPSPIAKATSSAPALTPTVPNPASVPAAAIAPAAPIVAPLAAQSAASAAPKVDLGISGIVVAADSDQPNRAGVLIVAVNSGSVAKKSGLIVGDILYEFNGQPIHTLAQLETAVAACAPNSAVVIKVFRGNDTRAVTTHF